MMLRSSRLALLSLCTALGALAGPGQAPPGAVTLKAVTYAELGNTIRKLKGKVIVVDVWADF